MTNAARGVALKSTRRNWSATSALFLALTLTACTNGMLGESSLTSSQNNNGTNGDYNAPPVSVAPTEIVLDADVVGTFKDYWATAADPDVGVVVNMKSALTNTLGQTKLEDYITKALTVTEIGNMKVHLDVQEFKTRFTFPFSKLARSYVENNVTKYQLNNLFIAHPRGKTIFGSLANAPVKAPVFQTVNRDVIIVGGKDADDYEMNQIVLVNANGTASLPNSSSPTWGIENSSGGGTMLYRNDADPYVIPFRFAQELFQSAELDFTPNTSVNPPEPALIQAPSWYGSMYNPVNFAVIQYIPGRPRVPHVDNVLEISFIIMSGAPLRATWCNTVHDQLSNTTNQQLYGCGPDTKVPAKRPYSRIEALDRVVDAQVAGQGTPATSGLSMNVSPSGGVVKTAIP